MRTWFDEFGKQMVRTALETCGLVETDAEVRADTRRSDPAKQTTDGREFLVDTQDIVETWRREAIQEGVKQGVAHALVEVYEARFGAMPEDLRTVVEDLDDEPNGRVAPAVASLVLLRGYYSERRKATRSECSWFESLRLNRWS